ncbi:pyridoxal phosphate enzyme (YggS family) [Allocatelliglobosispora scoriae]|uniref:Pyridoxal phosphate homeostasis protein n=1 Tax=Allocatelliglobosispora scoriae TaxID=643052 RepID=A0A841BPR6_9ACTN|nr:YggS family pyridoxal phosphate-dependent enzyme [Allocatelliglobosispora scoriae]MBB5868742.1 pyridoxal phosphate enzyme (YggS family) [Allocatelliglobosispora scoriae]
METTTDLAVRPADSTAGLEAVRATVADACGRAGRELESVTLVAVSKTVPVETLELALKAGQRVFGENRVQEARAKWPSLREGCPDLELHLLGPLQTNKVREAVELFDAIQSVDRPVIAAALAKECAKQGRRPKLFVQVNTGAEPQKAGILPDDADGFLAECREAYGLEIAGLMCIPPVDEQPEPHFTLLGEIAARNGLALLSMGMSADFARAVEYGATHVRVGTGIFGYRPPLKAAG